MAISVPGAEMVPGVGRVFPGRGQRFLGIAGPFLGIFRAIRRPLWGGEGINTFLVLLAWRFNFLKALIVGNCSPEIYFLNP